MLHRPIRLLPLIFILLPTMSQAVSMPTKLHGTITGTINGTPVNMTSRITLNYTTGREIADVSNVPVSLGSSLRAATALVTIGGGFGGNEQGGGVNVLHLTAGNFTNTAFQFSGNDTIFLNSTVSWNGVSDTANYVMSVSGRVRTIAASSTVQVQDFAECWVRDVQTSAARIGGPSTLAASSFFASGSRGILIDGGPPPPPSGGGKGSRTDYNTQPLYPFPAGGLQRAASNFVTTYTQATQVLRIECTNVITPLAVVPGLTTAGSMGLATLLLSTGAVLVYRRRRLFA